MIDTAVRQETFYVAQRQMTRDVLDVFVVRYTWGPSGLVLAEHLTAAGWVDHTEGAAMSPALSVPGDLAYLLRHVGPYDPSPEVEAVEALIAKVLGGGTR